MGMSCGIAKNANHLYSSVYKTSASYNDKLKVGVAHERQSCTIPIDMGEPPMFCVGQNVHDYIFTKLISSAKFVKILSLENFRLYGIIIYLLSLGATKMRQAVGDY